MLYQCAVPTRDVPEWLAILPTTALNAEFQVDITIHMAIFPGIVKMIEIKVKYLFGRRGFLHF